MYMPHPNNHKEWASRRAKYNADLKEKHQAKKNIKPESDAADPPNKSSGRNLSLAKIFKYALSTQVMLSDQESNQFVYEVLNGKFAEDYELK